MMLGILCLVLAYIAGSFPSGLVIGKTLYPVKISARSPARWALAVQTRRFTS